MIPPRNGSSGTPFKSNSIIPSDPNSGVVIGDLSPNSGATFTTVPGLEDGKKLGMSRTLYSITSLAAYKIDSRFALNSITAYRRFDVEDVLDLDGSGLPIIGAAAQAAGDQFSHEFRLNYESGGLLTAFLGASYFYENTWTRTPVQYNEPVMLALLTGQLNKLSPPSASYFTSATYLGGYAPAYSKGLAGKYGYALDSTTAAGIAANLPTNHWEQFTTLGKAKAADIYADATLHLTGSLELTAGVRYSHDDKTSGYTSTSANRSIVAGVLAALVPDFGFGVQPTSNSGRRPLEMSPTAPAVPYAPPVFTPMAAETVDSYEVGYKALAFDGTLRFDTAVYLYAYNNFRTTIKNGTQLVAANAGKANSVGTETSIDWMAMEGIDIFATYAHSHARFGGDSIYKGNMFRLTPDHKLSLGALITEKLLGGAFTFMPAWTWQSKMFFDDNNDIPALQSSNIIPDTLQNEFQGDYGLLNLKLSYQPEHSPLLFSVFASNVLDRKFIKDAGNSGDTFGLPTFIAGEPRFVGASLAYKLQ
jgi:iron complex outermembrane recepter protein